MLKKILTITSNIKGAVITGIIICLICGAVSSNLKSLVDLASLIISGIICGVFISIVSDLLLLSKWRRLK